MKYLTPALLLMASPALADLTVNTDRITATAGVYCAIHAVGQSDAPGTDMGQIDLLPDIPTFEWDTMTVPAKLGISFGIITQAPEDTPYGEVIIKLTHPPFAETGTTEQIYTTEMVGPGINAYSFDLPREVVTGDWTFTAIWQDEVMYKATFTVVPADIMPHIAYACGEGLLS